METTKEDLSPEKSLEIIKNMVLKAQKDYQKNSYYFLLWGWLLLATGIGEYVLANFSDIMHSWVVWPVMGILGGVLATLHGRKKAKEKKASTFADRVFGYIWMAFVMTLVLIIIMGISATQNPTPFVLLLTGLPTFASGGILKFKPLMLGGIIFWVFGLVAFYLLPEFSSLIFSLAILFGYIIPGYMLKKVEEDGIS